MKKYVVINRLPKKGLKLEKGDEMFQVSYNENIGIITSVILCRIRYNARISKYEIESLVESKAYYKKLFAIVGSIKFANKLAELQDDSKMKNLQYDIEVRDMEELQAQLSNVMNDLRSIGDA